MLYSYNSPLIWRVIFIQLSINWTCYICTILSITLLLLSLNAPQQIFPWLRLAPRHILFLSFDCYHLGNLRVGASCSVMPCLSGPYSLAGAVSFNRTAAHLGPLSEHQHRQTEGQTDRKTDRQILWLIKQLPSEGFSCFCLCLNDLVLMFGRNTQITLGFSMLLSLTFAMTTLSHYDTGFAGNLDTVKIFSCNL